MMSEAFEQIVDGISASVPKTEKEYMGEDGLLHCSVCHKRTQTRVEFMGIEKTVRCICDCRKNELEAEKLREVKEARDRQRRVCFEESNMYKWTFENDDMQNPKLSQAMQNYVKHFTKFKAEGKGLLMYGNVGTGKSYYAACIANSLIDNDYTVLMTNFARLTNKIQGMFEGKQEYIDSLNHYSLLIIDDLGAERKSEYMIEQVFNIVDARYRSGLPMIITTNLMLDELTNPQSTEYSRIYDRILERCHPILVDGMSRRRKNFAGDLGSTKELLGL